MRAWTAEEMDRAARFGTPREEVPDDDTVGIIASGGTAAADDINISADSPAWRESRRQWACVDTTRTVKTFTGANRAATIETGEFMPVSGGQTHVSEIRPIIDAEPGYVSCEVHGKPYRLGEDAQLLDTADMSEMGCCDVRAESRYINARIKDAAGAPWTEALGVNWHRAAAGEC